ncbi:MAG: asparagine synthase C-terminal domain-containing protein, partial [Cyclobacteriaceae bacterium]
SILKECICLVPGSIYQISTETGTVEISEPKVNQVKDQSVSVTRTPNGNPVDEFDVLLNRVIERQSRSDVPLGAFLSGGVDSSIVASILQSQSSIAIDTFTIGFNNPRFNEAPYAKEISKKIGTRHNELVLTSELVRAAVEVLVGIYDEPFANASALPTILLNQFARSSVKVALGGDGGDEYFAGYNRYVETPRKFKQIDSLPEIVKLAIKKSYRGVKSSWVDSQYEKIYSLLGKSTEANVGLKLQKLIQMLDIKSLSESYTFLCSYWDDPSRLLVGNSNDGVIAFPLDSRGGDFINDAMEWDRRYYLPGDSLVKSDRASMSFGLEVRLPLLDADVLEFSSLLDQKHKVDGSNKKVILKRVLSKYIPEALINRPKMGFTVPISEWLNTILREEVDQLLSKSEMENQGLFSYPEIKACLNEHRCGYRDNGNKLWAVYIFQRWYIHHFLNIQLSQER